MSEPSVVSMTYESEPYDTAIDTVKSETMLNDEAFTDEEETIQ